MSIITKPSVTKGTPAQFTLNKSELLQHSLVQADPYFSDSLNWYRVNLVYKSTTGSQYEIVEFDASQANPTGTFLISEKARDEFQIQKVQIMDFDGGFLEIPRSNLTSVDFDISIAVVQPTTILAGAYIGTPSPIQNKTSAVQPVDTGEGQDFTVNSPVLVSSVKVLLAKNGSSSDAQDVGGTLKIILKSSSYFDSGAEVESTTAFNLSNLKFGSDVNSNIQDGIIEFMFDTPVLLPTGFNSIKFKITNFVGSGLTRYVTLYGYPNQISGNMYSYGTALGHVDYWFQIIGTVV